MKKKDLNKWKCCHCRKVKKDPDIGYLTDAIIIGYWTDDNKRYCEECMEIVCALDQMEW